MLYDVVNHPEKAAGLLWLAHHLDRPIKWRWRPFVGVELAFFSLLGLVHAVAARDDPWGLVKAAQEGNLGSGGLVGSGGLSSALGGGGDSLFAFHRIKELIDKDS